MSKSLKISLGMAISLICLWTVFRDVNFSSLLSSFSRLIVFWVLFAIPVYLFGHFLRAVRWKIILSPMRNVSLVDIFFMIMFGFLINNVIPARAGELARAIALKKKTDLELPSCISSIVLERFFDLFGIFVAFCYGLTYFPLSLSGVKFLVIGLVSILILFGVIFSFRKSFKDKFKDYKLISFLYSAINNFKNGLSAIKSLRLILVLVLISIIIVAIELFNLILLSHSFSLGLDFSEALILYLGIVVGVAIPSSPGSMGTFELFGRISLERLGIISTVAVPFILFLHAYYLLINSFMGLLYFVNLSLTSKSQQSSKESI